MDTESVKKSLKEAIDAYRTDIPQLFKDDSHEPVEKGDINELATYLMSIFNALENVLANKADK